MKDGELIKISHESFQNTFENLKGGGLGDNNSLRRFN